MDLFEVLGSINAWALLATVLASTLVLIRLLRRCPVPRWAPALLLVAVLAQFVVAERGADAAERDERARMVKMLEGIAPTYAYIMSDNGHAQVSFDTPDDDAVYLKLIEKQKELLRNNPGVSDIYTLRRKPDQTWAFVVDSETDYNRNGSYDEDGEERTPIGEAYDDLEEWRRAENGQQWFSAQPYTDRWGTWITTAVPVLDDQGRIEAVLGVDMSAGQWIASLASARGRALWVGLTVIGVLAGAYTVVALLLRHSAERRQRERALREARDAAEAANRAKTEFLANMSHEIRTPMTAMLGYADLILDTREDPDELRRHVDTIQRNGRHLLGVINDILDISKIEAGKVVIEQIEADPRKLTGEVIALMSNRAAEKSITLTCDITQAVPAMLMTDPVRLKQILLNLLSNAVKFTHAGGTVDVRADFADEMLMLQVRDNGIGMAPEQINRLFRPFEQADTSTTRRFGGTGLGLSISKRLAMLMGGDVSVTSQAGVGSTFAVTLSARAVARSTAGAASQPARATSVSGLNVLVADDASDNRRLLTFVMGKVGASVTTVENGQQAVDAAIDASRSGSRFDVILMDMQMPVLDGYAATSELRRRGYAGPIIALTAHAMAHDRQRCLDAGCDDHATKPIDRDALFASIMRQLDRRQRQAA
jgi:signal transduction histidine kinase/ActR/RegA family two-component response regulator